MKKILFAMAALAALASCQKAEIAEQNSVNTNGERVITAYFDNAQTKTTLDDNGVTPKWTEGDKIMLLDGSGKQEITLDAVDISSDGKSVTFTTRLDGTLYAVYPSTATNAEKIETENSVPVTLPAEQDGTFGSANICVAKENNGSLAFKNVTSVLHLTQTAATTKVNEIIITTGSATAYIAGTGTVDMSTDGQPALTLSSNQSNKIKVKSASAESDYYIAVVPTTLPAGTSFGFATGSKLGGTNLSKAKTIAANTIYNIGSMDENKITPNKYHDYVEINGLKWATMNIGASSETDAGRYFAWGDVIGQTWSGSAWSDGGFSSAPDIGNPTTLPLEYDAANANWGSTWRMPTKDDFTALATECFAEWTTDYNGTGVKGLIVWKAKDGDAGWFKPFTAGKGRQIKQDGSGYNSAEDHTFSNTYTISTDVHIFFPAASCGQGTSITKIGSFGFYWSSSLYTSDPRQAYCMNFNNGDVHPQVSYDPDKFGFSVRPLSD